jgi:chorismate mutase / prephenate dehydratase
VSLDDLRRRIDETDLKILELLNERACLAREIGRLKGDLEMPFFAPGREARVLDRLNAANPGPLIPDHLRAIYREIMSACRDVQEPTKVAYWGPPASHSHTAVLEKFGASVRPVPVDSIADVFDQVEKGLAHYGVVPAENSTEGVIPYTLDLFSESDLRICGEIYMSISHHLLSRCRSLEEVKRVYVSPQPYAQCRRWLIDNLGHAVMVDMPTTSRAALACLEDAEGSAVAGKAAAVTYDLPVLCERIEDNPRNRTRFMVVGFNEPDRSGRDKTSLLIALPHRPGTLFGALAIFRECGLNLMMIQSRPTKKTPWEYLFFLDVQGFISDEAVANAVLKLQQECLFVRVLGSYPEAE